MAGGLQKLGVYSRNAGANGRDENELLLLHEIDREFRVVAADAQRSPAMAAASLKVSTSTITRSIG